MKKTPYEILEERKISLPNKHSVKIIRILMKLMQFGSDVTYKYSFDKKEMKGRQVILLADHATTDAYKYVIHGYPFADPNVVIGHNNIFKKGLFKLLLSGGIIPKKLYQADQRSVMDMLKVLKMGGSLLIFPEGIQATSGSMHPIFAGTSKLIKKAGVPVVLCKSYGSYLIRPRYRRHDNKGHQEYHYEILFTEQDLKEMSLEEIDARLLERFRFNDFEWNKTARNKYTGGKGEPLAKGIDSVLYYCPKCKQEFTLETEGDKIICRNCGNTVVLNEYYDLVPETESDHMPYSSIDEWFKHQRKLVSEEVKNEFSCSYECDMYDFRMDKLYKDPYCCCGEGVVTITNTQIRYKGTRFGENVDMSFDIKSIPSFVFFPSQDNDFYIEGVYYGFRPKTDKRKVVKYMLLVEEAHRLLDTTWDKISRSAYDVEK